MDKENNNNNNILSAKIVIPYLRLKSNKEIALIDIAKCIGFSYASAITNKIVRDDELFLSQYIKICDLLNLDWFEILKELKNGIIINDDEISKEIIELFKYEEM